jgi:EmrB/QacA subfamily drug resistance transporter
MTTDVARKRWTLVAVTLGLGITILDETVVFLALPAIDRDLGIGLAGQQWVVNAYLLPLAALLLLTGALADRYGRRRLFVFGLIGFGLASLAAGLAPSGAILIGARVVQGVFAALLMPSTLALLVATFRGEERAGAIGAWAAWSGAAAAVGPLVAGVLIAAFSWRWIFFLSLPIVAVAIGLALWAVEESREEQARRDGLDLLGALWGTVAVAGGAYAVVQGPEQGWTAGPVVTAAVIAPLALAAFLLRERRAVSPMLPLGLFRVRDFSAANGSTLALYAVFNGNFFLLTIYLQTALDYSALAAGAATLPLTMLMLLLSTRAGRLGERIGPRLPMAAGQVLAAGGVLLLSFLEPGDGYWIHVLPGIIIFGLGLALTVAPLTNTAVSAVPEAQAGLASGVNNAAARLAGLLGVAVVGLAFALVFRGGLDVDAETAPEQPTGIQEALERPTSALDIPLEPQARSQVRDASVDAYRVGMWVGSGIGIIGALIALVGVDRIDKEPRRRPQTGARTRHATDGPGRRRAR